MKNIIIAFFIGTVMGFVIFYTPPKPAPTPTRVEVPGDTQIITKWQTKYIAPESKVDLKPLYDEIETLKAENQSLFEWGVAAWNRDTTQPPPPVPVIRPLPVPAVKTAGVGLWPGVAASVNYEDNAITPSGYLTLQLAYWQRLTFGLQANNKEAGINLGYHVPMFRNLQVKALANKRFSGSGWIDSYGIGLGLGF